MDRIRPFQRLRWRASWLPGERFHSIRLIALHRLPPAIYGRAVDPDLSILVFAQHAPGPDYLEPKLRHLAENGYETITTREYAEWLVGAGRWRPRRHTVMLTFDDGLRGFAERTLPLLRRYGSRSVLFVCPGLTDLATSGKGQLSELARKTVLTWDELHSLHRSGDVDIQSHGMWHNKVRCASSPVAVGVERVNSIMVCPDLLPPDGRLRSVLAGRGQDVKRYPSVPFFTCEVSSKGPVCEGDLISDLAEAKSLIEQNLPGHQVRALAFPWWRGSANAVQAAQQTGHQLIFWGLAGINSRLGHRGVDTLRIGRLWFDWIHCLPGKGRITVRRLLKEKLSGLHNDNR